MKALESNTCFETLSFSVFFFSFFLFEKEKASNNPLFATFFLLLPRKINGPRPPCQWWKSRWPLNRRTSAAFANLFYPFASQFFSFYIHSRMLIRLCKELQSFNNVSSWRYQPCSALLLPHGDQPPSFYLFFKLPSFLFSNANDWQWRACAKETGIGKSQAIVCKLAEALSTNTVLTSLSLIVRISSPIPPSPVLLLPTQILSFSQSLFSALFPVRTNLLRDGMGTFRGMNWEISTE